MDLVLENLEFQHRGRPALRVARLGVAAGETVCLVGPSGSGKTTLLHLISGILAPKSGRICHGDTDIAVLSEAARDRFRARHVGQVFQTFNLLQGLSALENLLLPMSFAGLAGDAARAEAIAMLGRVGVAHLVDSKPARMSVGEQQRVAIARALAHRPKLVLADEPTASLDETNEVRALEFLRDAVAALGASLIIATHSRRIVAELPRVLELAEIAA